MRVQRLSILVFVIATVIGGWLRFDHLSLKPLHHDEGVNSFFLLNLARDGHYRYDPTNYHGPTLYYLALPALRIFGETDFALRLMPAAFGVLTILLLWPLRARLGPIGLPAAALMLALSPGLVFFSRDFIHETSFTCFTLAMVVGLLRFRDSGKFRWLAFGATAAGLLFATKETAIITVLVIALALLLATLYDRIIQRQDETLAGIAGSVLQEMRASLPSLDFGLAALTIFVFINLLFYSSLFVNWQGVADAFRSLRLWTQRTGSEHVKSFWYYTGLMLRMELPLLVGSLVAGAFIIRRATRFQLFIGAWTLGIFLAYSLIGYKTPWLVINILLPASLLAGEAAARLFTLVSGNILRTAVLLLLVSSLWFPAQLAFELNFRKYDDNNNASGYLKSIGERLRLAAYRDSQYGYVYVQTSREIMTLVGLIVSEVAARAEGRETGILVTSPDYWPLPWYLRQFPNIAWSGTLPAVNEDGKLVTNQPLIIVNLDQMDPIIGLPGYRVSPTAYNLRPGASLALLVREEPQSESSTNNNESRERK